MVRRIIGAAFWVLSAAVVLALAADVVFVIAGASALLTAPSTVIGVLAVLLWAVCRVTVTDEIAGLRTDLDRWGRRE